MAVCSRGWWECRLYYLNGYLIKHYGFKKVFMGGFLMMCAFVFVSFFGKSVGLQVAGQVLCG